MPPSELYLVRHAIAAERGEDWPDDDKRPLTERGIARFKDGVRGLAWLGVVVDEVFTSPLVRARQTAALLSSGLEGTPPVKVLVAMAPGHAPEDLLVELGRVARRRRIALVGHEPGLGELASHVIGAGRPIEFRKGGVCRIDVDGLPPARHGALVWCVTPKILRRLGRTGG